MAIQQRAGWLETNYPDGDYDFSFAGQGQLIVPMRGYGARLLWLQ